MTVHREAPRLPARLLENCRLLPDRVAILPLLPKGGRIVEIGVALGDFSQKLIDICQPDEFIAIDNFRLHELPEFWGRKPVEWFGARTHGGFYRDRFARLIEAGQVRVLEDDSTSALATIEDGSVDMFYVDADHSYEWVARELAVIKRKVKPDGVIIMNDYTMSDILAGNGAYGVIHATNEFMIAENWEMTHFALQPFMYCDVVLRRATTAPQQGEAPARGERSEPDKASGRSEASGREAAPPPISPGRFTAHNIRLDDGSETMPEIGWTMDQHGLVHAVARTLGVVFPSGLYGRSIVDIGCLEGGYTTAFARLGLRATGIEVRESNFRNCTYVKSKVDLPWLDFIRDDANAIARHGPFDAAFVNGLLYHLDHPRRFLTDLAKVTRRVVFLHTHVAQAEPTEAVQLHNLSELTENEGLKGRWYPEYDQLTPEQLEEARWASWSNNRSFWIQKEYLLALLRELGFDLVLEQFDSMPDIVHEMTAGTYRQQDRVLLVGIRTGAPS